MPLVIVTTSELPTFIDTACLSNPSVFAGSVTRTLIIPIFLLLSVTVMLVEPSLSPLTVILLPFTVADAMLMSFTDAV